MKQKRSPVMILHLVLMVFMMIAAIALAVRGKYADKDARGTA